MRAWLFLWGIGGCAPQDANNGGFPSNGKDGGSETAEPSGSDGADGSDGTDGADGGSETGETGRPSMFSFGDAITKTWSAPSASLSTTATFFEATDAAFIDAEHALVVGQGGWQVVSPTEARVYRHFNERRGIRVAASPELAAIATRESDVIVLDVSTPTSPSNIGSIRLPGQPEDISVDEERILVGLRAEGAQLFDRSLRLLAILPVSDAFGVALHGDRAVVTDADQLSLWDLSDLSAPRELHRVGLSAPGRDISWSGDQVAVGLGGAGVALFGVESDNLVLRGEATPPGAALSVALDGEDLWVAGWERVALLYAGSDRASLQLPIRGLEAPAESAIGIAARDGRAVLADWFYLTALQSNPDLSSPALSIPELVYFDEAEGGSNLVRVRNYGDQTLTLEIREPTEGWTLDPRVLSTAPGESADLVADSPDSRPAPDAHLPWTSNDPDYPSGTLSLAWARGGVGSEHPPMVLDGFVWPDPTPRRFDLAGERGKVVVLDYFALF